MKELIPEEIIGRKIFLLRGQKVMLSNHLAELYGVETRVLIQAVKRNIERFPKDFMFQLTNDETNILVSQNVIPSIRSLGGHLPYAFTEQGVAMLSGVLNSKRAIQVNILIMRAFIKLKELLLSHKDLAMKIDALEKKYANHDEEIKLIFEAIRQLLEPPKQTMAIGFHS